jgi:hypothetical protein
MGRGRSGGTRWRAGLDQFSLRVAARGWSKHGTDPEERSYGKADRQVQAEADSTLEASQQPETASR